jgi:cell division protein FtsA
VHLSFDREIVHKIVQRFSIDDQLWIKNPIGLYASRLACEVYIITAGSNSIQSIFKCVTDSGYDADDVVYTGIADACSVLSEEDKAAGVILMSMGASLTDISVFIDGALKDIEILQAGAEDFGDDFRTSGAFEDIVAKVNEKKENFKKLGREPKSIVVTGGVILTDGLIEYLEERLSLPVRMGIAKDIKGETLGPDNVRLCTAIGLAKYAFEKDGDNPKNCKSLTERFSSTVVDIFNNYF